MIRKVLGTTAVRIMGALSNLLVLWLAAHYLGSEQWGISGLVLLDVSLILLVGDMAGNALVFYSSRRNVRQLIGLAMLWLVMVMVIVAVLFFFFSGLQLVKTIVPEGFGTAILIAVFISGLFNFSQNILLGRQKILWFNLLYAIQFVLMIIFMLVFIFIANLRDAWSYVFALMASYLIPATTGLVIVAGLKSEQHAQRPQMKELLSFGLLTQTSSIIHLLNKRLGFYFIKQISGLGTLGVYNSGSQLAEGLRLIGQSIALVQLSSISNSNDSDYAKTITLQMMKLAVTVTFVATGILCLIPTDWYVALLNPSFAQTKEVVIFLSPGVIALAANAVFSHHFSGTGQPIHNLMASVAGFVVSVPLLVFLIQWNPLAGAAIAASAAYTAAVLYQWIVFRKQTNVRLSDLTMNKSDIAFVWVLLRKVFGALR